jgi:hypothetical protein
MEVGCDVMFSGNTGGTSTTLVRLVRQTCPQNLQLLSGNDFKWASFLSQVTWSQLTFLFESNLAHKVTHGGVGCARRRLQENSMTPAPQGGLTFLLAPVSVTMG